MDIFDTCHKINNHLISSNDEEARNELIKLLDFHKVNKLEYTPLVNSLIRETGLYPYIKIETASWRDRFIFEAFKVDIGESEHKTLHREQSTVLKRLIEGENIAISAPTSFGKSFIIDAYISMNKPKNVFIIVPTIALTDETRRRIYRKFSKDYKIITTTDVELAEKNIFIFPQERAMSYVNKIDTIDILIIDEFYKASSDFDKERSPALLKAIIKLGSKAKQKYFLAPNITGIKENVFTKGMIFLDKLKFNTVYLEKYELYTEIGKDETIKGKALINILNKTKGKSLIYAASYSQIKKVSNLLNENSEIKNRPLLENFANWLTTNYDANWNLTTLIRKGTGIHNGQLHRSLCQIQVKLFEEDEGLNNIISTSSIIEGVNTSAENVILWKNKKGGGNSNLDDFSFKNIIGRGGRMFKHFIGKIYLLEKPPGKDIKQLEIPFPDSILGDINEDRYKESLTTEQISKILFYRQEMYDIIGQSTYDKIIDENILQNSDFDFIKKLAADLVKNPEDWNGLLFLNSNDVNSWDRLLSKIIYLQPGEWGDGIWREQHSKFVAFIKILSNNWYQTIPELLDELEEFDIDIDQFFKLERIATFKLSALINDINILQKAILNNGNDISPFVSKLSHAFLPTVVYQLEEYGLPRMISKKIHDIGVINFLDSHLNIHDTLHEFNHIGKSQMLSYQIFDNFDKYILSYFYDGITSQ